MRGIDTIIKGPCMKNPDLILNTVNRVSLQNKLQLILL